MISGTVASASQSAPLEGVRISAIRPDGAPVTEVLSDADGRWVIENVAGAALLAFSKEGYLPKSLAVGSAAGLTIRLLEERLIGYQKRLWAQPGQNVAVLVNSPKPYRAQLLRHGIATETVMELGPFDPISQEVPDGNFVDRGLNWREAFSYTIPPEARPGLYSLRLLEIDQRDCYGITFVVSSPIKNRTAPAGLLVLASTNTWQSYNSWGGRSRYRNYEDQKPSPAAIRAGVNKFARTLLPAKVRVWIKRSLGMHEPVQVQDSPKDWRFRRLSIRRPFPNCFIMDDDPLKSFSSHLAAGEWRVLAWLEREGIPYDIISGWELSQYPERVFGYKALMLNTHCEYWTRAMVLAVKRFEAQGGWLLNLSGNSMYREIECFEDGSTRCISLRLSESIEDESALLGVCFSMAGYRTCAPFEVRNHEHWAFQGTKLKNGDLFAKESLNHPTNGTGDGGSGHETDKMTPAAPSCTVLLARGVNPKDGGADMVIIENPQGRGGVFSASSITFGGSLLIDDPSSRLVHNLITRALAG
jgi:hypothetical protein